MSIELDKRIAIEVMGEPEPPPPPEDALCRGTGVITSGHFSCQDNWEALELWDSGDVPTWFPVPFSSDLDQAMRAVDKYFANERPNFQGTHLQCKYQPMFEVPWLVWTGMYETPYFGGQSLPEAICNLLLALTDRKGG